MKIAYVHITAGETAYIPNLLMNLAYFRNPENKAAYVNNRATKLLYILKCATIVDYVHNHALKIACVCLQTCDESGRYPNSCDENSLESKLVK